MVATYREATAGQVNLLPALGQGRIRSDAGQEHFIQEVSLYQ